MWKYVLLFYFKNIYQMHCIILISSMLVRQNLESEKVKRQNLPKIISGFILEYCMRYLCQALFSLLIFSFSYLFFVFMIYWYFSIYDIFCIYKYYVYITCVHTLQNGQNCFPPSPYAAALTPNAAVFGHRAFRR